MDLIPSYHVNNKIRLKLDYNRIKKSVKKPVHEARAFIYRGKLI